MSEQAKERFVRFVSAKVKPEKMGEFRKVFHGKIIPRMRRLKGIRRIYLIQPSDAPNELASLTFWNAERDADAYVKSGGYRENVGMVQSLLSEDVVLKSYNVVEHAVGLSVRKRRK